MQRKKLVPPNSVYEIEPQIQIMKSKVACIWGKEIMIIIHMCLISVAPKYSHQETQAA